MEKITYLILGAGPSGLAFAHSLLDRGVPASEILVLEKESTPGGLCRSATVDGAPLDIGGGHFLDVKHQKVLDLLFRFLPQDEWERHTRISHIEIFNQLVDHPFEANLWQLDIERQIEYIESIAGAGCLLGSDMPDSFKEWITWKLGERIASDYMIPYNRKIWSMPLSELGTYWLYKLPDVSFRDTLASCLHRKPHGALPAHGTFLYPKRYGYGEVWQRMGEALGERLIKCLKIQKIDIENRVVNSQWQAQYIFSSVPWCDWLEWADVPTSIVEDISALRHVSIDVDYVPTTLSHPSHWIYVPDESIPHHRKLLRSNFAPGARGYWTETNSKRSNEKPDIFRHTNDFAYPVNTINKPLQIQRILEWASAKQIIGFGRWGTWEHMNSDIAVKLAIELSEKFTELK